MSQSEHQNLIFGYDAPVDLDYVSNLRSDLFEHFDLSKKKIEELHQYQEPRTNEFEWDDKFFLGTVTSMRLPGSRDRFIHKTHDLLRSRHDNGWIASGFYAINESVQLRDNVLQIVPALFESINRDSKFPTPFQGCSAYPLQQGLFIERTVNEFSKEIYSILKAGGAYSKPLDQSTSFESISTYIRALIGPNDYQDLRCFGVDTCFSLSFFDVAWDFCYVLYHVTESWAALIAGTDTD